MPSNVQQVQVWSHIYTVVWPLNDVKDILWWRICTLREKSEVIVQVEPRLEVVAYV